MRSIKNQKKSTQEKQDILFRKMSAEKKIRLASNFFDFAKMLNKLGNNYGTRKIIAKNR